MHTHTHGTRYRRIGPDAKRVQELTATEMALEAQDAKKKRELKKKQKVIERECLRVCVYV